MFIPPPKLNDRSVIVGPRLDWDPEVVAALDDDFNFEDPENELEDNFMEMAMGEGEGLQDGEREDDSAIRARGGQATIDFVASQRSAATIFFGLC